MNGRLNDSEETEMPNKHHIRSKPPSEKAVGSESLDINKFLGMFRFSSVVEEKKRIRHYVHSPSGDPRSIVSHVTECFSLRSH